MAYDARTIANYFLDKAKAEGKQLDPMGIQKLIYFAHGWNLAINHAPLIKQSIAAWDYGPVIPDVYQAFRDFGSRSITKHATKPVVDPLTLSCRLVSYRVPEHDTETRAVLDRVWEVYKDYTSVQLSNLTHVADSPWTLARSSHETLISNSSIKKYFESQASQAHQRHVAEQR